MANMNKLWPSINKNYYKIRKYILELSSLCGCEHFGNDEPCPTSIDVIVKKCYDYDAMDEDEKDKIVNNLSKDIFGVVRDGDQAVLCREDYLEYTQKVKSIRGALSNVNIEHEKVGRIMQDGGSALDDGDIKRVFCCFK